MTISQALQTHRRLRPDSGIEDIDLIRWLSEVDYKIYTDLFSTHLPLPELPFVPYDQTTPGGTELLAPVGHDGLYLYYLSAMTDYYHKDTISYNNSKTLYNEAYHSLASWYNSTRKPAKYHTRERREQSDKATSAHPLF